MLAEVMDKRKKDLALHAEKMRSHEFLAERASRLESSVSEKKAASKEDEVRLAEIQVLKNLLADLDPKLDRLENIKSRLNLLEPLQKKHEELYRNMAGFRAELEGTKRLLKEREDRRLELQKENGRRRSTGWLTGTRPGVRRRSAARCRSAPACSAPGSRFGSARTPPTTGRRRDPGAIAECRCRSPGGAGSSPNARTSPPARWRMMIGRSLWPSIRAARSRMRWTRARASGFEIAAMSEDRSLLRRGKHVRVRKMCPVARRNSSP